MTRPRADTAEVTPRKKRLLRPFLALLPPFIALMLQLSMWSITRHVWFLFFYPAVFLSSWIGGLRVGLVATVISAAAVLWFIVPPVHSFIKPPGFYFPVSVFLTMGVLFGVVHDRLRKANRRIEEAFGESERANERTRELDEQKTRFFAAVSHELRAPLTLILGPTDRLLQAADTPEPARRDLEVIARNARTLLGHVNDLLDVAKLEAGRMTPEYAATDVASLARFIAGHFEVLSREKNIAFEVEGPDALSAQVDPEKVQHILLNLLSNAFKFTPAGGRITLAVREAPGRVRLEVADSGPGIPPDKREAVFERFRQLEGGARRHVGGTGLGLFIVRELALLHEGSISVSEAPEGGALFVVDLPRAAPAGVVVRPTTKGTVEAPADVRTAVEALRARGVALAPAPTAAEGARVLVVEDNPEMNRFICESLESAYRVATAFDGEEGLRKALQLRPDLVLTDIMMPKMSGDELVRAIRSRPELERTPIVILTAKVDDALRLRLLREGAQDYLTKPFSIEELRARIGSLIAGKRALEIEAQWASLAEQAPDGIFVADLEGRYTDVNSAGCRMLGYDRKEIVGKTIRDLIPPDRIKQLELEEEQMLHGEPVVSSWVLRKKDGTWLPVEVSAKILPDGRWQAVVRDISERQRLEAALHASHADLVRAQSVAHVGSWRLDVRHNVLQWSDEEYRMFGVAPGTPMTYEAFLACVHPDDRAYVDREWNAGLRGQPYDIEHRLVVGDAVRWVREMADLEFDEHHSLVGGIGVTFDITDRKRREEALRLTQERLELALRGADLGLWDWNVASGEVVFNPRWAEMRGYRPEEIRGHVDTWISGVHPEDLPRVKQALEEHFQGHRPEYEAEHRVRTKSGRWIWILDRGKVFARNERGEPVRMAGTELDITSRKQIEEALRLAEAKSTGIVSMAADAIISVDRDQRITLFNDSAEKIFGYSRAEVVGAPLDVLIPERFRAIHRQHVEKFAEEGVSRRMGQRGGLAIRGLRKNGQEFPADAAISKLEVGGERILTIVLRDITEQRRIEREQRFLAKIGEIFASSLDPSETVRRIATAAVEFMADFVIVDLVEGDRLRRVKVAHADPARAEVARALESLPPDQHQPPTLRAAIETRQTLVLTMTEDVYRSELPDDRVRALVESMQPRSVMFVPLIARDTVIGVVSFLSSAPGRNYEAADVRLAEEVARRAALALENSRLYRMAHDAIKARDEILGIVAHDLRNPLTSIVMQASRLRRRGGEPERWFRGPADTIEAAANRMNRLIQDLLDVTRMEAGRLTIEQGRLRTAQVVTDAVEAQRPMASSGNLELQVDLAPDLPDVSADRDRLLQVFENLIGNALKFTEPRGRITVGAAPRDGEALFWVADTGSGIPEEDVPHLFDRFWQARKGGRRGAGLGLPIVKGIVEAHGGRVWVESTPGRGSTFFFTIPTAPRAAERLLEPASHVQ